MKIQTGKIYSRCDGERVYHQHVVLLRQFADGLIEGVNVVTGDAAFFSSHIIQNFYRVEK